VPPAKVGGIPFIVRAEASVAAGFRDACVEHGIPIDAGDMAYYVNVVTAKVAEMTPRLIDLELKGKSN